MNSPIFGCCPWWCLEKCNVGMGPDKCHEEVKPKPGCYWFRFSGGEQEVQSPKLLQRPRVLSFPGFCTFTFFFFGLYAVHHVTETDKERLADFNMILLWCDKHNLFFFLIIYCQARILVWKTGLVLRKCCHPFKGRRNPKDKSPDFLCLGVKNHSPPPQICCGRRRQTWRHGFP